MYSVGKNACTLNLGGVERTLKFSMKTLELYMNEAAKGAGKDLDLTNPFTRYRLLFYCGLIVGEKENLPEAFTIETVEQWIEDCVDPRFEEVNQFANEAMGFILSEETKAHSRNLELAKNMGMDLSVIPKANGVSGK